DLKTFLSYQYYEPTQRGADLSWWGKDFFSDEIKCRVMIISQDTMVKDAGSITLEAQYFPDEFDSLPSGYFNPGRRKKIKKQLARWDINIDFMYITDASKVFKNGSKEDRDFDKEKSKELLEAEIKFCKPDLIILLGGQPLSHLDENQKYGTAVESGKTILIKDIKCVVVPYFFGNGPVGNRGGKGFKERMSIATDLIKKEIASINKTKEAFDEFANRFAEIVIMQIEEERKKKK
ncbi:MAG: hypothetical protein ABSA74_03125, partial [Candidatus Staskawiczbacteria bacterium]